MHLNASTRLDIDPDGQAALLTQGSDRLWIRLLTGNGRFERRDARPLPASPNPSGQNLNTNYHKLALQLTQTTHATLAIWFAPLQPGEPPPAYPPPLRPLADWIHLASNQDLALPPGAAVTLTSQPVDAPVLSNGLWSISWPRTSPSPSFFQLQWP